MHGQIGVSVRLWPTLQLNTHIFSGRVICAPSRLGPRLEQPYNSLQTIKHAHTRTHTHTHQVEADDMLQGDWGSSPDGQPDVQAQAALVSALRALQKKKVWKIYICASTGSLGVCAACLAKNKGVKCFAVRCNLDAMAHVVCTPLCDLFCTACLAKSEGENKGNSVFAFLQPALPCTCWVLGVLVGCWVSLLGVGCTYWVLVSLLLLSVLVGYWVCLLRIWCT